MAEKQYEYGVIYFPIKFENWNQILNQVDINDVYLDEDKDGYELDPHITLLYGLHNTVKENDVYGLVNTMKPFKVKINNISCFESEKYDVLKLSVDLNNTLRKYREMSLLLDHTLTFPTYHPHITIAYLNKGLGKKYTASFESKPIVIIDKILYKNIDGDKIIYNL